MYFISFVVLILFVLLWQDQGVNFHMDGQDRLFRGSIGPFSNDNLGAHSIGGFIESFSSLRVCRVCMGTSNDIQMQVIL